MLHAPIFVAARASLGTSHFVAGVLGNGFGIASVAKFSVRFLTEFPVDFFPFQVVGNRNARLDAFGKINQRPCFAGTFGVFAYVVFRSSTKNVFVTFAPFCIEVYVQIDAVGISFPHGKITASVCGEQIAFQRFVAHAACALLTQTHAVRIDHGNEVDAAEQRKLRIPDKMFRQIYRQQCRQMFSCMNGRLNYQIIAVFLPHKHVWNSAPQFAFAHDTRFRPVSAKQFHFVQ